MTGHALATAAGGPVIPNFGGPKAFACERANRLFCWDWFSKNWDSVLWPALRQHVVLTVIAIAIGFAIASSAALLAYRHRLGRAAGDRDHDDLLHDPVAGAV